MQSFLVNDNNLWVNILCFLLYHACFLTKRKAFLSMEMPQIQIQNPFYFLMKLIGKLLCKKTQLLSQAKICLHSLFSFTCSYHSLIKLLKKKQFLIFQGNNVTNCFLFIIKQKRKCYYFCYLRRNSAPATANNCTKMLPKCFKKS